MKPAHHDVENRRSVWHALSDLFLDTELQDHDLAEIARILVQSPYSLGDIEEILFREVYPVCIPNLWCVAGEWDGFDREWLEQCILKSSKWSWSLARVFQPSRWMIRDDWNRVNLKIGTH